MDNSNHHNINSDLSCCLQSLSSHKITERKIKRQEILRLLEIDETIAFLNYNSSQQLQHVDDKTYQVTWKYLLNCCHRSLILDIEKEDIKKQKLGTEYKQPNLEISSILLKNIINKANKEHPYLPVDDLLTCILDVTRNDTFEFFMGEVYYKILEQNILSQNYYWHLLGDHWNDLFYLACKLYKSDFANMKHVSIKIMKHVVVRGDAHSCVAIAVKKKILLYLKQAILDTLQVKNEYSLREDLIILVFVVCKTVGVEIRKSLCYFIEENCINIINLYENDGPKKVQEILYQLLTFFIQIHHPKCIGISHQVSYAFDKKIWINQLHKIYEFVHREIRQSKNNSNPKFSNYISELAVTSFYTVYFNKLETLNLTYDECPQKKKKYDINLISFIGDLTNLKKSEMCTRLNIIIKLHANYPSILNEEDYKHLLQCIKNCLNLSNNTDTIKYLIICCNVLIKSEYLKLLMIKYDQVASFCKTVWIFILKIIMSNENADVSHDLLQSLIILKTNWCDEMYIDVLRPYFNKIVKIDDYSLKTLIVLFKTKGFCNTALNVTNIFLLLDWLLPINIYDELSVPSSFSKFNPYLLSEVMILILTKPSGNKSFGNKNTFEIEKSYDSMDICFYLELQDIPKVSIKNIEPNEHKRIKHTIDENILKRLVYFIKQTMLIEKKSSIATLQLFYSLTNFVCFLENQFPQISKEYNEFGLYKFEYMEKVKNIVSELKDDVNQLNNEEFVNVCSLFYKKLQFLDGQIVNVVLNHESNSITILKLYNLSKLNDLSNSYQVLNYESLTKKQKLSIKAMKVISKTCSLKGQILNCQTPLLEILIQDLKKLEDSICQPYTYFKITGFLRIVLSMDNLPLDVIIQINKFIKQLAKNWCYQQEGFIQITQLLCDALTIITKNSLNEVCTSNMLMIIQSLQKISKSKKCGPAMVCAFVELLGQFASTENGNFGYVWKIDTNIVEYMSPENILSYINSQFLQVRITVIKYIKVICDVYENNPNNSPYSINYEDMFNSILKNIHEGFMINISDASNDEYNNRISTYLLTMQSLLISSSKYRKKCLFNILQTVIEKNINLNLVINLLEGVAVEFKIKSYLLLLENYLNYLLWHWHFEYSSFNKFPIKLFSCSTMEQFLKKYPSEIIPILVIKNDLDLLNSLEIVCQAIKENFSVIYSYMLAINISNVSYLNHDEIKILIEIKIGSKEFNELLKSQFSEILLKCIQMIVINTEQPIVPIQINSDQFQKIINIFQETHVKSKVPLFKVMSKYQALNIQSIVHILYANIFKKPTSELRYQAFFQYTFFMKVLINQLSKYGESDKFTHFLVHQSVRSTITLINQNNFESLNYGLEYLEWLLTNGQRFLILNINPIQSLVSSTLRVLAKNQPSFNEKILELSNILRSLKNQNICHEINDENLSMLHKDIIVFLSQQSENTDIIQSLQHIKLKLKRDEKQLLCMYEDLLKIRGFSEDCAQSTLHRFICTLIQLTKSPDFEIQILAASCLGTLGPNNLTTLILQPEPEVLKLESNISAKHSFIKHIVLMLLDYLSDNNISVMEASIITLFKVMATSEGQSLYEKLDKSIIYPFCTPQEEDVEILFDIKQFKLLIDVEEMWCPIYPLITYGNWITNITKKLLETLQGFCKSLLLVAENKPVFCEYILPHLIYYLLVYEPLTRPIINKHLNGFFIKHYEMTKENAFIDSSENNIYCDQLAVQCFLNIVHFIRLQQENPLQKLLDINYLYISQAAQFCSAHFTSILYSELWCEMQFTKMKKDHWSMAFNPVDMITEFLPKDGLLLQSTLNESYKSIGDSDAIEGCGSNYLLTLSSRTQYYQRLRKWDRVMENCDLQQTTEIITKDYLEAFSNSGLQNVAHIMASNNDNLKYDYCWRLDKWDLPDSGDKSFEALHYHSLRYTYQKNLDCAISMINEARLVVIESLSCASLESTATIYTPLAKLKIIEDLEDYITTPNKNILFENWLNQKSLRTNDFISINKILSHRSKLFDFNNDNRSCLLKLNIAEIALKNGWLQEAGRNLGIVASIQNDQMHTNLWAKVEEARLLWQRNDYHMARVLLKFVVEELDKYEYPFLQSLALQLYGSWMEETKSETANEIIKKYFQKSINILKLEIMKSEEFGLDCKKILSNAHKHLSQFTDSLYKQLSKYIKTEDLQKRIHEVKGDKKKGKALVDLAKSTKNIDKMKAGLLLMNLSSLDESDISNINVEKTRYLRIALQNYLQLMTLDDESELSIYRVISLWLENKENNEINSIVDKEFMKNPSYKFVTILPQLVPHLNSVSDYGFHKSLENLINRCAMEHPYHTIPIIYAVANSNIDNNYILSKQSINNREEARVSAAKLLMSKWKRNTKIGSIVINIENLYEAFIHLAYKKIPCLQGQRVEIPCEQLLMKIRNSDCYMYPTATLPLDKHGHYENIISIDHFRNSFLNAGGLHQPKKIDCTCSDGIIRSLLLKGHEDMRQDAIMQQVFVLMNRLFQSNISTAKRKLTIRTYKIIPLSQQSGIAEWCVNTMSLGDYLVDKNTKQGAHYKYRPNDMLPSEARQIIKSSQDNGDSQLKRQHIFLKVCENLKPVLRYYFFEKFLSPSIWFERRQAYIHSVATTSMVGYILGLGDRHLQNILIDNNTAELIHIDFGVAFEQGSLLNTPETVPFRLSRDIVDGMGICGIEGTFRKCCEKTMSVLRQNQDVILTVIEVLLYDPCYQWTLTEEKAAKLQNQSTIENSNIDNSTEVNKLAERSLNKIRVKLCGMEEAGTVAASINGQCNRLIQQARDPASLALLFHGWQAYL